jgi:hypothetical protein
MKKLISTLNCASPDELKNKRGRDIEDTQANALESESEPASPLKKNHISLAAEAESLSNSEDIEELELPYYIEDFILQNQAFFNHLLNAASPKLAIIDFDANLDSKRYCKKLHKALADVAKNHVDSKLIRRVKHRVTQVVSLKIDFDQLIELLNLPTSRTDQILLEMICAGLNSWRLLKIASLYRLAKNDLQSPIVKALHFFERRRDFIASCMNKNADLRKWLDDEEKLLADEKHAEKKIILETFSDVLFNLLNDQEAINMGEKVFYVPTLMDIRTLCYTLKFADLKQLSDSDNPVETCNVLLNYSKEQLSSENYNDQGQLIKGLVNFFIDSFPSPWTCVLVALNGPDDLKRAHFLPYISNDVLLWLQVAHTDNKKLAPMILKRASGVDEVAKAFERHQQSFYVSTLAESIVSVLNPIHNSPTKKREKSERLLQASSPLKKLENDLEDLSLTFKKVKFEEASSPIQGSSN